MNDSFEQARKEHLERSFHFLPALRATARLKQSEIAAAIHITRESYNRIESGKRPLTWKTFLTLMAVYEKQQQTNEMIYQLNLLPMDLVAGSAETKSYIVLPTFQNKPKSETKIWRPKRCPRCGQRCWESDQTRSAKKEFPESPICCEDCFIKICIEEEDEQ